MLPDSKVHSPGRYPIITIGLGLALLYWLMDSAVKAGLSHEDFLASALSLETHVFLLRVSVVVFIFAISAYARFVIKAQKRAESDLKNREQHFRSLIENASDIILIIDKDMKLSYANPSLEKNLGYDPEKYLGCEVLAAVHPEDRERIRQLWEQAVKLDDYTARLELRVQARNGSWHTLEGMARNLLQNPLTAGIVINFRDITERKNLENALKNASAEWRKTFDTIPDIIMIIDANHKILRVNKAATRALGMSFQEIIKRQCFRIIHNTDAPILFCPHLQALKDGTDHTLEIQEPRLGGEFAITASPMMDKSGRPFGSVCVLRDITARRRAEKEMQKTQKLESLGVLAGGIAHDFNNILTIVLANIALLKKQVGTNPECHETLAEIENASLQAKNLTRQLLTFAKGGAPIRKPLLLKNLLQEAVNFSLHGSNVKGEFSLPDELWNIEADEGQIVQVINNLVINAVQAMPQGGILKVSAENIFWEPQEHSVNISLQPGAYVKISVTDHGMGISEQNLPKIFDPYFTTKPTGTGLGLATAYSIIKNHKGYIDVHSTPGQGTTFYIYLPASSEELEPAQDQARHQPHGQGRILFMDDEPQIRSAVSKALFAMGYQVETVEDGAKAIELYKQAMQAGRPFDAVIMDLTIPAGMGGMDTIRELKALDPSVKAVIASGYANSPVMAEYKRYGFQEVICKPYRPEEVNKILLNLLK